MSRADEPGRVPSYDSLLAVAQLLAVGRGRTARELALQLLVPEGLDEQWREFVGEEEGAEQLPPGYPRCPQCDQPLFADGLVCLKHGWLDRTAPARTPSAGNGPRAPEDR